MPIVELADLPAGVQSMPQVDLWLAGANAQAVRVAPCLSDSADPVPTTAQLDEALLVLVGAISRWAEAGSGAYSQVTTGPFAVTTDTRQRTGFRLWPSEIEQLQDICGGSVSGAFSVDTVAVPTSGYWTSPYWFQED